MSWLGRWWKRGPDLGEWAYPLNQSEFGPVPGLIGKARDNTPFVLFTRRGRRMITDRLCLDYQLGRRAGSTPKAAELDEIVAQTDRLRVLSGGVYGAGAIGCEVLLDTLDPLLLAELRPALAVRDEPSSYVHSMGFGGPTLEFRSGSESLATIVLLDGTNVRWSRWRHDVPLRDPAALREILGRVQIAIDPEQVHDRFQRDLNLMRLTPASRHAYRAESYRMRGDMVRAREECERGLALDPNCWFTLRTRAILHHQESELDAAERDFTKALEAGAPRSDTLRLRALVRSSLDRYQDALEDCDAAERAGQGHAEISMTRGMVLMKMNRIDDARAALDQSEKLSSDPAVALWNRAMMELDNNCNQEAVEALDRLAAALRRREETNAHVQRSPHRSIDLNLCCVLLHRGRAQANLGQHSHAFQSFDRAEKEDPTNLMVHEARALLHLQRDEHAEALASADHLVELAPLDVAAHMFRARVRHETGDLDGALEDLSRAAEVSNEPHRLHGLKGQMLMGAGRVAEARSEFDEVLAIKADELAAFFLRAQCWRSLGIYEEQRDDLVAALALEPENGMVLNSLAWLYCTCPDDEIRDGTQAVDLARRAAALEKPANANVLDTLAAAYAEVGQFDDACQTMRQAIAGFKTFLPPAGLEIYRARLALYESGEAYRET